MSRASCRRSVRDVRPQRYPLEEQDRREGERRDGRGDDEDRLHGVDHVAAGGRGEPCQSAGSGGGSGMTHNLTDAETAQLAELLDKLRAGLINI
ncbi:MAG: hypothetical protein QOF08_952 [Gaiellales bacterium]|nr:hypothetical protein [Gaiellales bacterium]